MSVGILHTLTERLRLITRIGHREQERRKQIEVQLQKLESLYEAQRTLDAGIARVSDRLAKLKFEPPATLEEAIRMRRKVHGR